MAGVLLRRSISGHWMKLPADMQNHIKNGIFLLLKNQPNRLVRLTVANLLSILVRLVMNSNSSWEGLVPNLFELSMSPNPEHREAALLVFESIFQEQGEVGGEFNHIFGKLYVLYDRLLNDEDMKIRIATIKAIAATIPWLGADEDINLYKAMVPRILNHIKQFIQLGANELAVSALSIFDDLVETSISVLKDFIPMLVQFALEVGQAQEVDLGVRQEALTIIQWLAQYKNKYLSKNNFIPLILRGAFQLCSEPEPEGTDEWDITAHKFGTILIDKMARHVSAKKVFNESMAWISKFVDSPDPNQRKAAMGALMILPRGCPDIMIQNLNSLLPFLFKGMKDNVSQVREVACLTLGQFSEHLQPDIVNHYKEILPLIFQAMNEPKTLIQERSCYSLVAFLQCAVAQDLLNQEIVPYIEPLMSRLLHLLKHSTEKDVQEMAISGISATAHCAGKQFLPWAKTVLEMVKELMAITDPKTIELRCRAIECAGILAIAIGKENFFPYVPFFMEHACKGLMIPGLDELRDYTFGFFANIAEVLREDFKSYLEVVMPLVVAGCESTDGISTPQDGSLSEIFDEDNKEEPHKNYSFSQSFVDEKVQALHALSLLSYNCGHSFIPYLERCMKSVLVLMKNLHPSIRKSAFQTAESLIISISKLYPAPKGHWKAGIPAAQQPLSKESQTLIDTFLLIMIKAVSKDYDRSVAYTALESINQILKALGPAAIETNLSALKTAVTNVLLKTTNCQVLYEDSDEEEGIYDADEEESDNIVLFQNACEVVGQLSKLYGASFIENFEFVDLLANYAKPTIDTYLKQEAIGTIAEIVESIGAAIKEKLDTVMQIALAVMRDPHPPTQSNACYLCGITCEIGGAAAVKFYTDIFNLLGTLLQQVGCPELVDNSCAVIARIISTSAASVPLPLDQLLPTLLSNLPLKKDFNENKVVYGAIHNLFKAQHPMIAPLIPKIIHLYSVQLNNPTIQNEVKEEMAAMVKAISLQFPQQFTGLAQTLSPEQQQTISKCLK
eukprot:TRINITY_DN1949_c0_g1_i1.p1 TRINITY_DN1949_c0_g1~~TRINITY_DN1949_c0_g1_i1.p1  ORF type:complete len:1078 (+),score=300.19 TRINITY_DN1949_c0_g1_i1:190-3234(+)